MVKQLWTLLHYPFLQENSWSKHLIKQTSHHQGSHELTSIKSQFQTNWGQPNPTNIVTTSEIQSDSLNNITSKPHSTLNSRKDPLFWHSLDQYPSSFTKLHSKPYTTPRKTIRIWFLYNLNSNAQHSSQNNKHGSIIYIIYGKPI